MSVGNVDKYIVGLSLHHALCHARPTWLPRSVVDFLSLVIPRLLKVG